MKIDIVICTYNRQGKLIELLNQLNFYSAHYNSILVVDSSDVINPGLTNVNQSLYIYSSHKNQPFQRYLGFVNSKADVLIFLDDDMEVANSQFLEIIENTFQDTEVSGMAINFIDKHEDTSLSDIPKSVLFKNTKWLKKIASWVTGYPVLPDGKFGLCGLRGKQPLKGGATEWLSGGAFAARRSALFQNFNFQLFDLFEQKLGMGEDVLIGYGLSKQGKLVYNPELLFYHNDQRDSSYSIEKITYSQRVIYSRLYLSLEKARLDSNNFVWPKLFYHWHTFWRIAGLILNYLLNPSFNRKNTLKGSISGWKMAMGFKFSNLSEKENYWQKEARVLY